MARSPQLLHRHSLIRIDAFHRILFAIKLGFPALAGRCGHAHPIARGLPRAGDPSSVFIEVLETPRTGGRIGSGRPLGNPHKLDFCLVGLAAVGGISTPVLTNGACVNATRKCRINCNEPLSPPYLCIYTSSVRQYGSAYPADGS